MNSEEQDRRTLWCGNLAPLATDELLFELFLQAGPVERVCIPKDKEGKLKNFGFVTFKHEESVLYAMQIMDGTTLFGRNLNMRNRKVTAQRMHEQQQRMNEQHGGGYQQHNYPMPMAGSPVVVDQQAVMQQLVPQMNAYNTVQLLALQGYQAQMNYQMQNNMMPKPQHQSNMRSQGSPSTQEYYQNRPEMHERRHGSNPDDRDRSNSRSHNRHNRSRDKQHRNDRSYHRRRK
ncbi:hypothetical protein B566_EDAN000874 [Ephemera danica]|nr:hypothetical protein B566_EDAN000874 [Ephemera danica]